MSQLSIADLERSRQDAVAYGNLRRSYDKSVAMGIMTQQEADAALNRLRREIRTDMKLRGWPIEP